MSRLPGRGKLGETTPFLWLKFSVSILHSVLSLIGSCLGKLHFICISGEMLPNLPKKCFHYFQILAKHSNFLTPIAIKIVHMTFIIIRESVITNIYPYIGLSNYILSVKSLPEDLSLFLDVMCLH